MVEPESGSKLREEREAARVSRESLARAMGMTTKTVERWEKLETIHRSNARAYRQALARAVEGLDNDAPRDAVSVSPAQRNLIVSRVNQAAHRLQHRRAQGASQAEIIRLQRELYDAIDDGLATLNPDPRKRAVVVSEFVALFDRPPMRAGVQKRPDAGADTEQA